MVREDPSVAAWRFPRALPRDQQRFRVETREPLLRGRLYYVRSGTLRRALYAGREDDAGTEYNRHEARREIGWPSMSQMTEMPARSPSARLKRLCSSQLNSCLILSRYRTFTYTTSPPRYQSHQSCVRMQRGPFCCDSDSTRMRLETRQDDGQPWKDTRARTNPGFSERQGLRYRLGT